MQSNGRRTWNDTIDDQWFFEKKIFLCSSRLSWISTDVSTLKTARAVATTSSSFTTASRSRQLSATARARTGAPASSASRVRSAASPSPRPSSPPATGFWWSSARTAVPRRSALTLPTGPGLRRPPRRVRRPVPRARRPPSWIKATRSRTTTRTICPTNSTARTRTRRRMANRWRWPRPGSVWRAWSDAGMTAWRYEKRYEFH